MGEHPLNQMPFKTPVSARGRLGCPRRRSGLPGYPSHASPSGIYTPQNHGPWSATSSRFIISSVIAVSFLCMVRVGKVGSAAALPCRRLQRAAVGFDYLTGALDAVCGNNPRGGQYDAIQIEVVELTEPCTESKRRRADDCHDNPWEVEEEVVQFAIHRVSPFRVCGTPFVPLVNIKYS